MALLRKSRSEHAVQENRKGDHHIWFQFETTVRQIHNGGGGSHTFVEDTLTESTDFGLGEMAHYLGTKHAFTIRMEGDTLHQSGALSTGLKIQEIWRQVK